VIAKLARGQAVTVPSSNWIALPPTNERRARIDARLQKLPCKSLVIVLIEKIQE